LISDPAQKSTFSSVAHQIATRASREVREALPPTIFFLAGFNFIVLTTNLLLADYALALGSFMLATLSALVVGKAVLVANAMPYVRCYDRAPLLQPILFKTAFYWVITTLVRVLEQVVHSTVAEGSPLGALPTWHRLAAVSLWIFVLFLIYVTASEVSRLFGPGELRRLLLTSRPADFRLDRRQRIRELMRLSRLMDAHSVEEFRDAASPAHAKLIEILEGLEPIDRAP
jgi:hypothetical protein